MQRGFSLVELSIVLVILGLLTGGILGGQSLIRASEMRSVTTEYNNYVTATQTFRDKYFAMPGDMGNATAFWGAADSGDGVGIDCTGVSSTTPATCNGNGDGEILYSGNEIFRFWQHLANAGLINGTYTGASGSGGTYHHVLGTNAPRAKMNNAGWGATTRNHAGDGGNYTFNYGNAFYFGAATTNDVPREAIFKPEEAWNIDTKMDDGMPGQGRLISINGGGSGFSNVQNCNTSGSSTDYSGTYRLNITALKCAFYMRF